MPCVPGAFGVGSFRAIHIFWSGPVRCSTCTLASGRASRCGPTSSSSVPMRRPAFRSDIGSIRRCLSDRSGRCALTTSTSVPASCSTWQPGISIAPLSLAGANQRPARPLWFAPAKDNGAMDIPGCQVLQDAGTLVLVVNAHRPLRSDRQRRMEPMSDLNAGLLIGTEDELVGPQRLALPLASVQVEHRTGPLQKMWIARKDPTPKAPGTQGIVGQPAPDGSARRRDFLARETVGDFDRQFTQAVATQRHLTICGTFARQGHDQRTRRGCDHFRSTAAWSILKSITALGDEPSEPAADGRPTHSLLARERATA